MMPASKQYAGIDWFRLIAALLVIANHTSPLADYSETADFLLTRVISRLAVPFFLTASGYFLLSRSLPAAARPLSLPQLLKKPALLYLIAIIIYLPINMYAGHFSGLGAAGLARLLLFEGTLYHLWYLPAAILGLSLLYPLVRGNRPGLALALAGALYLLGLGGDSYYGWFSQLPLLQSFYELVFRIFGSTRNGLFMAPLFLMLGLLLRHKQWRLALPSAVTGLVFALLLLLTEGWWLQQSGLPRNNTMYLALLPCLFFLFQVLLGLRGQPHPHFRNLSMWVYILHPLVIVLVRGLAKAMGLEALLIENSLGHFLAVCLLSFGAAGALSWLLRKFKKPRCPQARAWLEIDLRNLRHNLRAVQELAPPNCSIMPTLKADAYGHGALRLGRELYRLGCHSFCVATAPEAVALRRGGLRGEILILGYTPPQQFSLLRRYRLSQTVVDAAYAAELNRYGKKIRVHIKIDSGMHRLGEEAAHLAEIRQIFTYDNLQVQAVYSHLQAADSAATTDIERSKLQISRYEALLAHLQGLGIQPKQHLHCSYSLLNYPEQPSDYARLGLALFGVIDPQLLIRPQSMALKPLLAWKTRIALVRKVEAGEPIGYGQQCRADKPMRVAVLPVGYADGLMRSLSYGQGEVLIDGQAAPILGLVCMDQTLVDITAIPQAKPQDTVVIIGNCGALATSAYDLAARADTIPNEILSRLGNRLERVYLS